MIDCVEPPDVEIIPPGEGLINVVACPHPFHSSRITLKVEAGHTIAEIIALAQPEPVLRRFAHVAIGDHVIEREYYHLIRPKPGTRMLIRMLPTGGVLGGKGDGGGGKNPLSILVSIVSVIAAIAVPALIPGIANIAIAGSMTVGTLISGAILVAGGIISNQLAAPAKPKLAALSAPTVSHDRGSPTLSISGARNSVRPNSVIASILGTHWQVPALAAPTYTEFRGTDQYLTMCVVWGIGPLAVTDRKIGETPISSFQGVEIEFRRGFQPNQINFKGDWNAATGTYPQFPQFGDRWMVTVPGTVGGVAYNQFDTITYNGFGRANNAYTWDVNEDKLFRNFPYDIVEESEQITLSTLFQQRTTAPDTDSVTLDFVFYRGLARFDDLGNPIPFQVTIDVQFALIGGGGGWVATELMQLSGAQVDALRVSHHFNLPVRGQYNITFRRTTDPSTDSRIVDDVALTSMKSIRYEPPFDHRGGTASNPAALCCEVIRIRATDQLQGVVDDLSGICSTICQLWDGATWYHEVTNNPGYLFRHIHQNAATAVPLRDDELNLEDIKYWAWFCSVQGYTFNHIVDYPSTLEQIAADLAAAGRASVTRRDNKVTLVVDEPATVPVQAFTPRNSWDFRSEIQYPDLPHGFRVKFIDARTGKALERLVFDDGYDETNAYLFETLELTGVSDPTHAFKMGRYHIATARLRRQSVSFRTDMEGIVCTRGDLIRFSHDVPMWGLKSGRVTEVFVEGNSVIGVRVDEELTMEDGNHYAIRFRRAGAAMLESLTSVVLAPGTTRAVSMAPVAIGSVDRGDIFWFGESGLEHRNLRVHAIVDPQPDMSAKFICIEDNNAVYTAEYGPIPPYDPGLSEGFSILYPRIIAIRSDGTVVFRNATGNYDNRILVIYSRPSGTMAAQIAGVEANYQKHGTSVWHTTPVSPLNLGEVSLTEVDGKATYNIWLRFVRKDGSRSMWSPAEVHTVISDDNVPPDISFFVVTRMSDGTRRFEWRMILEPEEVVAGGGYRIKYQLGSSFDWDTATNINQVGLIPASPWESNDLSAGLYTFGIKAVTASGAESGSARTLTIELGDPRMRDVLIQSHEHLNGWPGTKTDCFVWGGAPRHLHAGPAEGARWELHHAAWTSMTGVKWSDMPRVSPISYTTLVFTPANGRALTFTPRVEVDGDDVTAVEMRTGSTATAGNLSAQPWGPLAQVVQMAYVQFRVTATGPKINQMIITVDGQIVVDDIEDINTLTTNETWFQRLGVGHFRVAVRTPIAAITGASIRAIQSNGTNWTWQLVSKAAQVGANPNPAAEFKVYNGGTLTDALVDVELKGPLA